jgi:hypothetical protein
VEMGVLHEITGRQQDRVFHNRAPRKFGGGKRSRRRETCRRLTCIISAGDACIRNTATKITWMERYLTNPHRPHPCDAPCRSGLTKA